ncbi:MAG TPA: FG-GAP-like repeat-containing protein, partial [Myxococcota bacterium]|nr:FG-GAP-like repeat-containing protein [Myxococcota bacterium]
MNDTDPDGDALTATLVTPPSFGTVDLRADGSFEYRPGAPADEPLSAVPTYVFRGFTAGGTYQNWRPLQGVVAGDLDGDGRVEIVGVGHRETGFGNFGWLVAFRANPATQTFDLVWANHTWGNDNAAGYDEVAYSSPLVLADLDGDGPLEIIAQSWCANALVVFEHTGALRFTQGVTGCPDAGNPKKFQTTAADLDQDGKAEILRIIDRRNANELAHLQVLDGQGNLRWARPLSDTLSESGSNIVAADLDLDGRLEIVTRRHAFDSDGNPLWEAPRFGVDSSTIFTAVVNLNDDPFGEVVSYSELRGLEARTHDGRCLWRARHAQLSAADDCPLTLVANLARPYGLLAADLDGDGRPELVLVSGYSGSAQRYVSALRADGTLLWQWQTVVEDVVFNGNDIAAFDFDGDGAMEVVVAGFPDSGAERSGVVFLDGRTGTPRLTLPANDDIPGAGGTAGAGILEVVKLLVLDVDGDRTAELVVSNDGYWGPGRAHGVVALKSGGTPWMPTRPTWPQYNYAITDATPSGAFPAKPAVNWLTPGLNNFRVNAPLPDEAGGSDTFTYTAGDGELTSNEATVHLELRRKNTPPVFLGRPKTIVGAGLTYRERLFVTDPDPGDTVTLRLARGPAGMTLVDDTLTWSTTVLDLGEHSVLISARDAEGALTTLDFTLRVVTPSPVPDVIGLSRAAAEDALDDADFTLGRIGQRHDLT